MDEITREELRRKISDIQTSLGKAQTILEKKERPLSEVMAFTSLFVCNISALILILRDPADATQAIFPLSAGLLLSLPMIIYNIIVKNKPSK